MPFKTMKIASLFWTLCSEVTFDVSHVVGIYCISHPNDLSLVHLERKGSFSEHVVRFWVAEVTSALVYLHKRRIVHRYAPLLSASLPPVTDHLTQRYKT